MEYDLKHAVIFSIILLGASCASATTVLYDTSAPLTGTRSVGFGLTDGGGTGYDHLTLTWNVQPLLDGTFDYTYTLTGFTSPNIGHVLLDLSDACVSNGTTTSACLGGTQVNGSAASVVFDDYCNSCQGNSDPNLPAHIIGVKITTNVEGAPVVITFNSSRAPAWGDFYLKGGQQYVYNNGITNHASELELDFVARPDTSLTVEATTPEPATFGLSGLALVLAGVLRRNSRRRAA
jgi:hypothetical protein